MRSFSGELQEAPEAGQQHRQGAEDDGPRGTRSDGTHHQVSSSWNQSNLNIISINLRFARI